jgi:hypothetical protein
MDHVDVESAATYVRRAARSRRRHPRGEEQVDYQPTQWAQLERLEGQARSLRAGTRGGIRTPVHAFLDFTYSCQAGAEHFQQCAEFLPLRNCGLGPLAVAVLPIPLARRAAARTCADIGKELPRTKRG